MATLVVYTSVSGPQDGTLPVSDKILHFTAYTALTMSLLLAAVWAPVRGEGRFPTAPLPVVLIVFQFGVTMELIQAPLPERDAELLDSVANGLGTLTALVLWMGWRMLLMRPQRETG